MTYKKVSLITIIFLNSMLNGMDDEMGQEGPSFSFLRRSFSLPLPRLGQSTSSTSSTSSESSTQSSPTKSPNKRKREETNDLDAREPARVQRRLFRATSLSEENSNRQRVERELPNLSNAPAPRLVLDNLPEELVLHIVMSLYEQGDAQALSNFMRASQKYKRIIAPVLERLRQETHPLELYITSFTEDNLRRLATAYPYTRHIIVNWVAEPSYEEHELESDSQTESEGEEELERDEADEPEEEMRGLESSQIALLGRYFPRIRSLTLSNTGIQNEQIATLIRYFPALTELDISGNSLEDRDLITLSQAAFAPNLQVLDLQANNFILRAEGLSLDIFRSLTHLRIGSNAIGNGGLLVIAEATFAPQLAELDVSSNEITSEGLQAAVVLENQEMAVLLLHRFESLTDLDVGWNDLFDTGLGLIAAAPFARNLTLLDIDHTRITAAGLERYLNAFTNLTSFSNAYNLTGQTGLSAIARAAFAPRLTYLNISYNNITADALRHLSPVLNNFRELKTLKANNNRFSNAGLAGLLRLFSPRSS